MTSPTMTSACYDLTSYDLTGGNDLLLAWHEDEEVTRMWLKVHLDGLLHRAIHVILTVGARVQHIHGKSTARNHEDRHIAKKGGELGGVHSGRGHNKFEVIPS